MENYLQVKLPASNGETVSLDQFIGKNIVLYFYPKDMTPGCTTEACDFGGYHRRFAELDTIIVGVSPDSIEKHHKFISKYQLPFLLLSDENHLLADCFSVWKLKKFMGREFFGIERSTFVFNKQGELMKEWRKVRVKDHTLEVLAFVEEYMNKLT